MKIGDLVRVHWGNCNWEGVKGADWGYSSGIVVGDIVWWNDKVKDRYPCGNVVVLERGQEISYNIGRCKVAA